MSDQVAEKKTRGRPRTQKVAEENSVVAQITEATVPNGVIGAPTPTPNPNPTSNLGSYLGQKTVISGAAEARPQDIPQEPKEPSDKVAVLSTRNLSWSEVGNLKIGYNIVSKGASEKWLTMRGIRIATPEEVATHYGK